MTTVKDVLETFIFKCSDQDGVSFVDWKHRICEGDCIYNILEMIAKDPHNPAWQPITKQFIDEIEGWL